MFKIIKTFIILLLSVQVVKAAVVKSNIRLSKNQTVTVNSVTEISYLTYDIESYIVYFKPDDNTKHIIFNGDKWDISLSPPFYCTSICHNRISLRFNDSGDYYFMNVCTETLYKATLTVVPINSCKDLCHNDEF